MDHNRTSTAFELLCLGTGSAFTTGVDNWQSNFFLSRAGEPKGLLIDCGGDCRHAMAEQGLSAMDVEAVYISHPHADHIGGLEWLAFATFFDPRYTGRPLMWTSDVWVNSLWEDSLRGGLASLQGQSAKLDTFFDVRPIPGNGVLEFQGLEIETVQTIHVMDGRVIVPSFGLIFDIGDQCVFLTTDTQFAPNQIRDFYNRATVILQDCEVSQYPSGVHAHYKDLCTLPDDVRAKMWLYHYQGAWEDLPDARSDGFLGFLAKGQRLVFDES